MSKRSSGGGFGLYRPRSERMAQDDCQSSSSSQALVARTPSSESRRRSPRGQEVASLGLFSSVKNLTPSRVVRTYTNEECVVFNSDSEDEGSLMSVRLMGRSPKVVTKRSQIKEEMDFPTYF